METWQQNLLHTIEADIVIMDDGLFSLLMPYVAHHKFGSNVTPYIFEVRKGKYCHHYLSSSPPQDPGPLPLL